MILRVSHHVRNGTAPRRAINWIICHRITHDVTSGPLWHLCQSRVMPAERLYRSDRSELHQYWLTCRSASESTRRRAGPTLHEGATREAHGSARIETGLRASAVGGQLASSLFERPKGDSQYGTRSEPATYQPLTVLPLRMLRRLLWATQYRPTARATPEVTPKTPELTSLPMPRTIEGGYSLSPLEAAAETNQA